MCKKNFVKHSLGCWKKGKARKNFPFLKAEMQDIRAVIFSRKLREGGCNLNITRKIYLHGGFRSPEDIELKDNLSPICCMPKDYHWFCLSIFFFSTRGIVPRNSDCFIHTVRFKSLKNNFGLYSYCPWFNNYFLNVESYPINIVLSLHLPIYMAASEPSLPPYANLHHVQPTNIHTCVDETAWFTCPLGYHTDFIVLA